MTKVGRNDPCPCGSGKKNKKCCGNIDKIIDFTEIQIKKEKDMFFQQFFGYLLENWEQPIAEHLFEFKSDFPDNPEELYYDDDYIIISEAFAFHKKVKNGVTPFEQYLQKNSSNYRAALLSYLNSLTNMYYSLYKIIEIHPDDKILLKDLLLHKEKYVRYEDYLEDVEIDDVLFCQISNTEGVKEIFFNIINVTGFAEYLAERIKEVYQKSNAKNLEQFLVENAFEIALLILKEVNSETNDEEAFSYEQKHILTITWLNSPHEYLANLSPIEAINNIKGRKILQDFLKNTENKNLPEEDKLLIASCKDMILEQLGLPPYQIKSLEKYQWTNEKYKQIAQNIATEFKDNYTPLQTVNAIKMWFDFSETKKPRIVKPEVWVAVIEYVLLDIEFAPKISQELIAEKYLVSPTTIGKNYRELKDVLSTKNFPENYTTSKVPIELEFEDIMDLANSPDKAEELIDQALQTTNSKRRIELSKEALAFDPFCVDAFVILGDEASTWDEAVGWYEMGVQAGQEKLGEEFFEQNKGHFWLIVETRPYMRAKMGLAQALWEMDEKEKAIQHLFDMLELNPNDNQGVRHLLSNYLLALDEHEKLSNLLKRYINDDSIYFLYNGALLLFKQQGDTKEASAKLKLAMKHNRLVPEFLLDKKRLPKIVPDYYSLGSKEEAVVYLFDALENWQNTPSAIGWISKYYWYR